jgi:tRNA (cytidine56-2'-O)-methyltransferase
MLTILRIGHRPGRDDRNSTHCGLVARALGADAIIYSGDEDSKMVEGLTETSQRWGGKFSVSYEKNFRKAIEAHKKRGFFIVHLTMYGLPLKKQITKIRKNKKILVIVGSEKVPGDVYHMADANIGVGNQPHSEVAALAVFLHEFFKGKELDRNFSKAKIVVVPQKVGKLVKEVGKK